MNDIVERPWGSPSNFTTAGNQRTWPEWNLPKGHLYRLRTIDFGVQQAANSGPRQVFAGIFKHLVTFGTLTEFLELVTAQDRFAWEVGFTTSGMAQGWTSFRHEVSDWDIRLVYPPTLAGIAIAQSVTVVASLWVTLEKASEGELASVISWQGGPDPAVLR